MKNSILYTAFIAVLFIKTLPHSPIGKEFDLEKLNQIDTISFVDCSTSGSSTNQNFYDVLTTFDTYCHLNWPPEVIKIEKLIDEDSTKWMI